jgi:hypothetical protein
MKYTAMLLSLFLFVSAGAFTGQAIADEANKKSQTISQAGSQPSLKGPAEYFTGNVRIDPLFAAKDSAQFSGAYVTFIRRGSICSSPPALAGPGNGEAGLRRSRRAT